jgi:hypothetical protein
MTVMSQDLLMREGRRLPAVGSIVRYRTVKVGEIKIFYREAGPQGAYRDINQT